MAIAMATATPVLAQDAASEPAKYQPFGEVVATASSDDAGVSLETWLPLVQGDSALLYVDGRVGMSDDVDYYANVGGGVRAIIGDSVVVGGYGFFDFTRTEQDRDFYGATFGAEVMTSRFELRGNYYLPSTENRFLGTDIEPVGTLTIEANELVERRDTLSYDLDSMEGVDAEVGVKLFGADDGSQDFRLYGGAYHYWDDQIDDVDGGYGEAEYRLHGLLGEGSFLSVAGRVSDDNWRGTEVSGQVRLRISFGKPRGAARRLTGAESRMTEQVRRRGTIVTQVRETPGTLDYNVVNNFTGQAFGEFFFVDGGNTVGSGDIDDPTTLGDAATRAGAGDYIVAEGNNGTIATTGVTLADDASLVGGGGTILSVRLSGGGVTSYTLGAVNGTIANSSSANDTLTLGDGNYIADVTLTGGANAIAGAGITDVAISGVTISGTAGHGISIDEAESIDIDGLAISGTGGHGISIDNAESVDIDDLTITGVGETGVRVALTDSFSLDGFTIAGAGQQGLVLADVGQATVTDGSISGGALGAASIGGAGTVALSDLTLASDGSTVLSLEGIAGDLYIAEFSGLTIEGGNGETGGVLATNVIFDANPGTAAIETVDGGDLAIGTADDRVGGGGLVLDGVLGAIAFGDLDIYTDGGDGLYIRDGEGKVGTFAFANTSGTIDAIGGAAVDIDPVTMASAFDSLTSTGSPGAGLIFDHVSGSFTSLVTEVTGSTGPAISITDSEAEFSFGATTIVDPEGDGVVVNGTNGDIEFGDTSITGLGAATGVDVSGAQGNVTFNSLDIQGTGAAGSVGIDMSGSTNAGFVGTVAPSSITGVDIGVDLSDAAITGTFQFGDGSDTDTNGAASLIDANIPIYAPNLGITGTYNLLDAELVGDISGLAGDDIEIFFVDSTSGAGTAGDPGTIAQAELSGADIIVIVDDGSGDLNAAGSNGDDTFLLAEGQQLTGFYGQSSFQYTQSGPQSNLQVHGLAAGTTVTVNDPTGNGGATLVSTTDDALTLSGDNLVDHVIVGDSAGFGVMVDGVSGSVEISDSDISSLGIDGGSGTVALVNTDLTGSTGSVLSVTNGHSGALTIDSASAITDTTGSGVEFNGAAGTYDIAAPISLTGGDILILDSPGTFDFTGVVTLTASVDDALTLGGANGTINFGTVDIVNPGLRGIDIFGATNDITFADASVGDSAGTVGQAVIIDVQAATSTITFDNLDLTRDETNSDAFAVFDAEGSVIVTAGAFNNAGLGDIVRIENGSPTVSIGATLTDTGAGNGILIDNLTGGTVNFTGNYTKTGTNNALAIGTLFGTGGAITFGGNVTISGGANIVIEDTASLAFTGAVSVSGATANAVDISGANGTVNFANLDIAVTADNTVGLDLNGATFLTGLTATDFDLTSTSSTGTVGVDLRNGSGTVRLGDLSASGASASVAGVDTGFMIDNTSNVTFTFGDSENTVDVASVIDATGTAIDYGNNSGQGTFNFVDVDWNQASNALSYQNLLSEFTIYYVDAEGDGNGTAADPGSFDDVGAQTADVIIMVNQNGSGTDTIQLNNISQGNIGTVALHDGQGLFSFNGGETIDLAPYGYTMGGAPDNFEFTAISGVGTLIDNPGAGTGAPILTTNNTFNTINIDGDADVILGGVVIHNDNSFAAVSSGSAASVVIDDSVLHGASYGLSLDLSANGGATAGIYTISNSSFTGDNNDGLRIVSGAGDSYTLTVTDSSFSGDTGLYAATFNGGTATVSLDGVEATGSGNFGVFINRTSTGGALTVTELQDITVTGGASGLSVAGATGSAEVTFDAAPLTMGLQEVTAGNIHLGTTASPIGLSGLVLVNVSGSLEIADLQSHVSGASALIVDNAALETNQPSLGFTLSTLDGDLSVAAGTATYNGVFLRAIDADLLLDTVSIVGGDYGLSLDTITGVGTASNALTIADLTIDGTLTGGVVLTAVNGAVTITDGAIGASDDPAGIAVDINGGTGNVSIGADITKAGAGNIVEITGRSIGTIDFSGALLTTGLANSGIVINTNSGGTINFSGPVTLSTGSSVGININSNTGGTVNFTGAVSATSLNGNAIDLNNSQAVNFLGGLIISTSSGYGIDATGISTLTVSDDNTLTNSITTTGGRALNLDGTTIGAAGITFDTVNVTGALIGMHLLNVSQTGGTNGLRILDGSIANAFAGGEAVRIENASANIYIGADLSSVSTGRTIQVFNSGSSAAGGNTIEFAGLVNEDGLGIALQNNDQNGGYATVVFSGTVDIDAAAGATYGLLQQNGGNLTVTGAMDIDVSGNTDGIQVNNNGTYTSTFSSTSTAGLSITSENGNAFEATAGGNISVTAQTSLTATGVGAGLVLGGTNTGNTVTFNAGGTGLDISTLGVGPGLYSTDGSTLSILGTGNSITTNTAQVMALYNGTIGAGGINFDTLTGTAVLSGFHAIYLENMTGGTVAANTVNITGGSAGIYVIGAANVDFGTVTLTPANTGIVLNATTGTLDFGNTTITNPGTAGVALVTSTAGTVHFDNLDIALNASNTVGVSLYGAALGAALTADDFDLTSSSASGTVGIDLTGATGDQTVRFGDTVVGGESASIAGVDIGVLLDDASDINFVFGDGEGTTDVLSSIAATTAIDFTDATGANGNFNFYDVFYPTAGSTDNLESAIDVYWIDADGDGNGSMANPGSFDDPGAAAANVIVLVDTNGGTADTIDLASANQGLINSYQLADDQVLASFNGGDTIDLTDYGFITGGGAPGNILLTGIEAGGTTLENPYDGVVPILTSSASGANVIVLGSNSSNWIDGVRIGASAGNNAGVYGLTFAELTITDSVINGTQFGLDAWFSSSGTGTTSILTVSDSSFSGQTAGLLAISGANDDIEVTITDSTFSANAAGLAALYLAAEGGPMTAALNGITADGNGGWGVYVFNSGPEDFIVTAFSGITVIDTAGYGLFVGGADGNTELTFDADPDDPGLQPVAGGNLSVSAPTPASNGFGLYMLNVAGQLDFGDLDIQSTGLAGLTVNNSALKTAQPALGFTLTSTSGTINSVNAPALFLDPLTLNMTLTSVSSSGGTHGIDLDEVAGTLNILGGSITGSTSRGVDITNSTLNFGYAGTISNTAGRSVNVTGHATGTVTFSGAITDAGAGINLANNTNATINFTGGLNIDSTTATGFSATNGGILNITGTNTIDTTTGQIVVLDGVTAGASGITFTSLTSTGTVANNAIYLNNLDGSTFSGGTVNITDTSGASSDGIYIGGGSAATINFTSATIANTGDEGIEINGAGNGTVTFGTVAISGGSGNGVVINGADGAVNINGGSISAASGGWGVYISGGTGDISIASSITKTSAGKVVEVDNHESGTVTFSGNLSATGGFDNGILVQNVNSGSVNFTGSTKTLTTGANTAISLTGDAGGTVTFTGGGLAITTTTGTGISANSGTLAVTGSGNSITTGTGQIINFNGVDIGAAGVTFDTLQSTGNVTNTAIMLNNVDGTGTFDGGNVTVAGTTGGFYDGIAIIGGSAATFLFDSATIGTTGTIGGDGIELSGANGSVTFTTVDIDGTALKGVRIDSATNAIAINGGTIGATDDSAQEGVDIFGGSGAITIAANISKSSGGATVRVDNHETNAVTFSGNITTGGTAAGIVVQNSNSSSVNFTGAAVTLNGSGNGVYLGSNAGAAINFNLTGAGLDINTTGALGFYATDGGTLAVTGTSNTIQVTTGTILELEGGTDAGTGGINFASLTSTATSTSSRAIRISDLDGTSFSGGAVTIAGTVAGQDAILLGNDSSANVSFGVTSITNAGDDAIEIAGASSGTVTFGATTISGANGHGINVNGGAVGDITFASATINGVAGNGITLNGIGATNFTVNGGSIGNSDDPAGYGVYIGNTTGNISIGASITKISAGRAVNVNNHETGTVTFSGNITTSGGGDNGILVLNVNSGSVNFTGQSISLSTGANTAVSLVSNDGGTIKFDPASGGDGLDIVTTNGYGFRAVGGGTIIVLGSDNTIQTSIEQIIALDGVIAGTGGINFASLTSLGSVQNTAIYLNDLDGTTFNGGNVTIAGTSGATSDGIYIGGGSAAAFTFGTVGITGTGDEGIEIADGSNGTINFGATTISNTGGDGIQISGAGNGAITFSSVNINNTGVHGVHLNGSTGTVNINGGSIGSTNDPSSNGVIINGGSGTVSIAASVTKNASNGSVIYIFGRTGGTVNLSGDITATGGFLNGIVIQNNTGGTINFTGQAINISTGVNDGVYLLNNTGSAVNFTLNPAGSGLDIVTTTGTGFEATGGGTITVTGPSNAISTGTGTALYVDGVTIGASGLTFQSISSNGAVNGIVLNNTGSGGLTVQGNGSAGSGGTIQNSTGDAISLTNAANVSLYYMNLTGTAGHGINASNLAGTNGFYEGAISDWDTGNTVTKDAIHIVNTTAVLNNFVLNSSTITGDGTSNDGLFMESQGSGNMTLTISSNTFQSMFGDGVQVNGTTGATATIRVTIDGNIFQNAATLGNGGISLNPFGDVNFFADVNGNTFNNIMKPTTTLGAIGVTNGGTADADITIRNNDLDNIVGARGISVTADGGTTELMISGNSIDSLGSTSKYAISVNSTNNLSLGTVGNVDVTISNNLIGQAGALWTSGNGSAEAVFVTSQSGGSMDALIIGNTIDANANFEVVRARAAGTGVMNVTFTNNDVDDTAGTSFGELAVAAGTVSGQGGTLNASFAGNSVNGGLILITESNSGGPAGTVNIQQTSAANITAINNGAAVTEAGTTAPPNYGQPSPTLPTTPTLP